MEVYAFGTPNELCRPCIDCGRYTGSFCDGVGRDCMAAERIPSETWVSGQATPLCSLCDVQKGACHMCRGVHLCRPFAFGRGRED